MADIAPIAPVAPAIAVAPAQPAPNSAPAAFVSLTTNVIDANFLTSLEQSAALQNEAELVSIGQTTANGASALDTSAGSDNALLDSASLANLSPQALNVLSEANTGATSVNPGGKLTPAQLEEIVTLRNDALLLNATETTTFTTNVSLPGSASSVNLSPQAVSILNGINSSAGISVGNTLTSAQLQQIAGIIAPFINAPLTQETLTQTQNALSTAGFNPTQLSLQTMFLSMNYLAELLPASSPDAEQLALNETITTELTNA